jgi:hypothetical protein
VRFNWHVHHVGEWRYLHNWAGECNIENLLGVSQSAGNSLSWQRLFLQGDRFGAIFFDNPGIYLCSTLYLHKEVSIYTKFLQ